MNYTVCADIYANETNAVVTYFGLRYISTIITIFSIQKIHSCSNIELSMLGTITNFLNQINAENITTTITTTTTTTQENSKLTNQPWFIALIVICCLLFCALIIGVIASCGFLYNLRMR